jgi:hypothetical protein
MIRTIGLIMFMFFTQNMFAQNGIWYKGDLHAHSTHSDGEHTIQEVIKDAENKGFTFFTLTDHDNIYTETAGVIPTWQDTAYHSEQLVLLYGVEWTTDNGHANIWNSAPFEYGDIFQANLNKDPLVASEIVKNQGGIFSINHPQNEFLKWNYTLDFNFSCLEILNGPISYIPSQNDDVISNVWEPLLKNGKRINAVGGSDMHKLDSWFTSIYPNLGTPTTYIYSKTSDANGIIEGIHKGHVCISNSHNEPHLEFYADTTNLGLFDFMMGDNVCDTLKNVMFKLNVIGLDGIYTINIIKNGNVVHSQSISILTPTAQFSDIPGQRSYYRIELIRDNEIVSLSNPIYFGYQINQAPTGTTQYEDFDKIEFFPNPANEYVYIRNKGNETFVIDVFSTDGHKLISKVSNDKIIPICINNLTSGLYIAKIFNGKTTKTIKIIKK